MTTYKGINGFAVQSVASDPSPLNEGQVWYNNATYAFKIAARSSGTWASGGNLNTARGGMYTAGTQTANLVSGGAPLGGGAGTDQTELYNGTSWTTSGAYPAATAAGGGCGTQTAALGFTGAINANPPAVTTSAEFNGSTWTVGNPNNTGRRLLAGTFGTQTAAIGVGGFSSDSAAVESYDGTTWTTLTSLPATRGHAGAAGTQTAGIQFGDRNASPIASVLLYNGTAWTSATNMNTARFAQSGSGTQTSAVQFGGNTPTVTGATEEWNGTSWFNSGSMATARSNVGGSPAGTQAVALAAGGLAAPGNSNATEEYTGASNPVTKTITTS
jgi:hypothetical protein